MIAPHGGKIEPGSSEIAAAIAGESHSLYSFDGLRRRPHRDLHITSTNFDEPRCENLIATHDIVVSMHGLDGEHDDRYDALGDGRVGWIGVSDCSSSCRSNRS